MCPAQVVPGSGQGKDAVKLPTGLGTHPSWLCPSAPISAAVMGLGLRLGTHWSCSCPTATSLGRCDGLGLGYWGWGAGAEVGYPPELAMSLSISLRGCDELVLGYWSAGCWCWVLGAGTGVLALSVGAGKLLPSWALVFHLPGAGETLAKLSSPRADDSFLTALLGQDLTRSISLELPRTRLWHCCGLSQLLRGLMWHSRVCSPPPPPHQQGWGGSRLGSVWWFKPPHTSPLPITLWGCSRPLSVL